MIWRKWRATVRRERIKEKYRVIDEIGVDYSKRVREKRRKDLGN